MRIVLLLVYKKVLDCFNSSISTAALFTNIAGHITQAYLFIYIIPAHLSAAWSSLDTVYYNFVRSFLKLPPASRNDVIGRLSGFTCSKCSYGVQAILYCRRVVSQRGPELVYKVIRTLWLEQPNSAWMLEVIKFGNAICPDVFKDLAPGMLFEDFVSMLTRVSTRQWTRHALTFCQSKCMQFRTGGNSNNSRLLTSIIPGFIGLHWVFKSKTPRNRATLLILTGSWRWARENVVYAEVSRVCHHCRMLDTMSHLLFNCSALSVERRDFVSNLSCVLHGVVSGSPLVEESIEKALSTRDGTELMNDFCLVVLDARRESWKRELLTCVNCDRSDQTDGLLSGIRNLFM
jgi:hypothetical protein